MRNIAEPLKDVKRPREELMKAQKFDKGCILKLQMLREIDHHVHERIGFHLFGTGEIADNTLRALESFETRGNQGLTEEDRTSLNKALEFLEMIKTGGVKDFAWKEELAEKGITFKTMFGAPIPFSERDRDHDFFVLVSKTRQKKGGKPFENQSEVSSFCERCSGAIESILKGEAPSLCENGENPLTEVRNLFISVFRESLRKAEEDVDRLPR